MVLGTLIALLLQRLPTGFRLLLSIGLLLAGDARPVGDDRVGLDVRHRLRRDQPRAREHVRPRAVHAALLTHPAAQFLPRRGARDRVGAVPFVAFALYAGLTQVPDEVLEASQLDGAGGVQQFRLIVFPYLKPIFLITTILQIIWDLKVFTQIFALQDIGGIREQTNTLGVYIYQVSIAGGDFGTGGAIAVITAIILMSVSLYYIRQTVKEEEL